MIRFRLPASAAQRLAFAYSPLFEAVLSLHVLVEPRHHPLQHDWVRRMRELPAPVRRDVHAFAFAYRSYVPQVLAPAPEAGFDSFDEGVERLKRQPPAAVALEFTVPLAPAEPRCDDGWLDDAGLREAVVRRAAARGRETARLVGLLLDDPPAFVAQFIAFLTRYWDAAFAAEWQRVERVLAAAVVDAERQIASDGLYRFLPRLSPELLVDATAETVKIRRHHDHDVDINDKTTLTLTPSAYVWPHVRVNCDPPWPPALVYPAPALARGSRAQMPPEDLLRLLRALADPARLELLRLVAAAPRSTQELAPLVGMTEAGASRSLRVLAAAGLLVTRRQGRYLLYELVPERLELTEALRSFVATAATLRDL